MFKLKRLSGRFHWEALASNNVIGDIYALDSDGDVIGITDHVQAGATTRCIVCDDLDQLATVTCSASGGPAYVTEATGNISRAGKQAFALEIAQWLTVMAGCVPEQPAARIHPRRH